jgi:hypothetical protein
MALASSAGLIETASARDYYDNRGYGNYNNRGYGYYDDRRHDRRQAVVAGAVRHEIAEERAEARYRECMRGSRYDQECDRQRWYDEQEARRKGRRTAVAVSVLN